MTNPARSPRPTRTYRIARDLGRVLLPDGHGLPGADAVDAGGLLLERIAWWQPHVRAGVRAILIAWDLSPLPSRHRKRFCDLDEDAQRDWVHASYRSRTAVRRLHVAALKQLLALAWASAPHVEDALGYDYRCRRDDEPHGAGRTVAGPAVPVPPGAEPADYLRPGPAVASGAFPLTLAARRDYSVHDAALETHSWPDLDDGRRDRADVVVVGSGAGGAVAAAALAEAGLDVIVLEEGPQVTTGDLDAPLLDRFQRLCRDNGATQVWGAPPIPLPLGRVVGGTTVVNSGTCFRAPKRVLERWESEFGVDGAHYEALAPYYERVEGFLNVRPVPWAVLGPNGAAAHRGAVALGLSGGPLLRNIADCHGCGQCAFGCPTGAKQAMHVTYLPRAARAGARIYARVRADRVVVSGGRARGVRATLLDDGDRARGTLHVDAAAVVVAAGAVHTPVLLRRSRVPDRSRQTGRNLRIHPATGVAGVFADDIVSWKGTLQSYYIDALFDSHEVMFEATATVPAVGAGGLPGIGPRAIQEVALMSRMATLGFYVSDTSSGRVLTTPRGGAIVTYRMNELDARRMYAGVALAAEVLLAAGAVRVYPGLPGIDAVTARADLDQIGARSPRPEHLRLAAFHPMGSARMGADPDRAVVDPHGRHHQVEGLWVADASTFPSCVGVNPQMTIMAFALRTAERIAAG